MSRVLIVGSGLTGAVIARELATAGIASHVIERRSHIAGNCYTTVDGDTGIIIHKYGAHIFHTDNEVVWRYVNQYAAFEPFICRVKATTKGRVYSLPINLLTINQFYGRCFSPAEAKAFLAAKCTKLASEPGTFEEQALSFVGRDLYEAFFKGYPIKQWGLHPRELPASVLKRLPVRYNYDDNYFLHRFQGIPVGGYTPLVERLLDHPMIEFTLRRDYENEIRHAYSHVFYSGPLDGWFGHRFGRLGYRTLEFQESRHHGDYQGCAVMSYPDVDVPHTRVIEHKHFTPSQHFDQTIVYHEYSKQCSTGDEPYYPIRLAKEMTDLAAYLDVARSMQGVSFVGRLGTYRYLDMDVTIQEALKAAAIYLQCIRCGRSVPALFD